MSRFFAPEHCIDEQQGFINIEGKEAHHILVVMRMRENDKVKVFNGKGIEYSGTIITANTKGRSLKIKIESRSDITQSVSRAHITLIQALPKRDKMDYIVQKATELGVDRIIPCITSRTVMRPGEGSFERKILRWRKIAEEASKQCGRKVIPVIDNTGREFAETIDAYNEINVLKLMPCLADNAIPVKTAFANTESMPDNVVFCIGPEGGFTSDEIIKAAENGFLKVSLGRDTLKSDTAGLFVLSVIKYEYGI